MTGGLCPGVRSRSPRATPAPGYAQAALRPRLFAAVDARLERVAPQPWGAVVTDPRYPLIHDANYARVDDGAGLTLDVVRRALEPALRRAGAVRSSGRLRKG